MIRYAITIFLSAFLLFQIQPMIARKILPWFGGTAAVWTTCLMFFQIVLLLGYLYSHLLRKLCSPQRAWIIHIVVLAIAACFAQISPAETLKPAGDENLTLAILSVLSVSIGLPFFALSTTGPLVQAWQSCSHPGRSPYRLYALSNLGSMLALASYPFLVERFFSLEMQSRVWSFGFLAFAGLCFWSGRQTLQNKSWEPKSPDKSGSLNVVSRPGMIRPAIWMLLAAAASVMLLATTNLLCQEVASVPFLWILPLSLYLLSFIVCFDRPTLYRRKLFLPLLVVSSIVAVVLVHLHVRAGLLIQILGLSTVCFAASMTCHGELERMKPAPEHLTFFYLLVAVGGSIGGIFVAVIAPQIFTGYYEFHIALLVSLLVPLGVMAIERQRTNRHQPTTDNLVAGSDSYVKPVTSALSFWMLAMAIMSAAAFVVCSLIYFLDPSFHKNLIYKGRNEYGLVAVKEEDGKRIFLSGNVNHGAQFLDRARQMQPGSYYQAGSGVAVAFESYREFRQKDTSRQPLNVGILGLGAGGMLTWANENDNFDFFEINPLVEEIARKHFTFISASPADTLVYLGDGRVQLQRLLGKKRPRYDLLFMDAFSSDAIPIHLLTTECFSLYKKMLDQDGILVIHITNRFVDLRPVVYSAGIEHGLEPILIDFESDDGAIETRWVLLTANKVIIESDIIQQHRSQWPDNMPSIRWADDYSSLAALVDWSKTIDLTAFQTSEIKNKKQRGAD